MESDSSWSRTPGSPGRRVGGSAGSTVSVVDGHGRIQIVVVVPEDAHDVGDDEAGLRFDTGLLGHHRRYGLRRLPVDHAFSSLPALK